MRINLIPMAGEGQRYVDAGYQIPKPFIDVDGVPMVIRACQALPKADRYIFVCRKSHLEKYPMEEKIKEYIPNAIIVTVDHLTEGQAITCMAAREFIPDDAILTIGASDNDMTFQESEIESLFMNDEADGWIWTFRNNPAVLQNPKMYGWVETCKDSIQAKRVSCKIPLSETPMNDHAIIGAFTFKKAKYFFEAVEAMVHANERINNEFYVDVAADFAIRAGLNMQAHEVDQYICWGTPQDYITYQYWLEYFKRRI